MYTKMSRSANIVDHAYIDFHTDMADLPYAIVDATERFGILSIKTKQVNIIPTPSFFLFTIDRTGSMQEVMEDNITNMGYAIQTMKNMVNYLSKQTANVFIQINVFNSTVDILVPPTKVSDQNTTNICDILDTVVPSGMTNIGAALQIASETCRAYSKTNPTHNIAHVFMTDGEPTDGISATSELTSLVNTDYPNINIGFGHRHNVHLMRKLSDLERSYYSFIDNAKNTSMIYGEIMHMLLYSAAKDVRISVENGQIYNWRKNKWDTFITEPFLIGDSEKIYHIRTTDVYGIQVKMCGKISSYPEDEEYDPVHSEFSTIIERIPDLVNMAGEISAYTNLIPYAFRQKVLELLYRGQSDILPKKRAYKSELSQAFKMLQDYMQATGKETDPFLCQLCDDLSITYRTCSMEYGTLYAMARSTTQGGQQSYTPGLPRPGFKRPRLFPPGIIRPPKLKRGIEISTLLELDVYDDDDDTEDLPDEISQYQSNRAHTSCYASPSAVNALHSLG
jgi:uncharacterized protein YegL